MTSLNPDLDNATTSPDHRQTDSNTSSPIPIPQKPASATLQTNSTPSNPDPSPQEPAPLTWKWQTISKPSNPDPSPQEPASSTWQPWQLPADLVTHFPHDERAQLDPRRLRLHIKLLTFNRPASLVRFLHSLEKVNFLGDSVSLQVRHQHISQYTQGSRGLCQPAGKDSAHLSVHPGL